MTASGILALALLIASQVLAQGSPRSSCEIPRFRGTTSPGGATVDVTVVNNGRPCRVRILSDVDAGLPPTELGATETPAHGTLAFPGPGVVLYTPSREYTGPDSYTVAGRGPTRAGHTVNVRLTVRVTVVKP